MMQPLTLAPETDIPVNNIPAADGVDQHSDDAVPSSQPHGQPLKEDGAWLKLNPAQDSLEETASESRPAATEGSGVPAKASDEPPKVYTNKDVSKHNTSGDLWLIIDNEVFNVTEFRHKHPGGAKILAGVAGKDATKKFDKYHRRALLDQYKPELRVGILDFPEAMKNSRRGFLQKLGVGK